MWGAVVFIGAFWLLFGRETDETTPTPPVMPYARLRSVGNINCDMTQCHSSTGGEDWYLEVIEYKPNEDNDDGKVYVLGDASFNRFYPGGPNVQKTVTITSNGVEHTAQYWDGTANAFSRLDSLYTEWYAINGEPSPKIEKKPEKVELETIDEKPRKMKVEDVEVEEVVIEDNTVELVENTQEVEVEEIKVEPDEITLRQKLPFQNNAGYSTFKGVGLNG